MKILKHCGAERNGLGFYECAADHCPCTSGEPPDPETCDYPLPSKSEDQENRDADYRQRVRDFK